MSISKENTDDFIQRLVGNHDRSPQEIFTFIDTIGKLWLECPHLSFAQIIANACLDADLNMLLLHGLDDKDLLMFIEISFKKLDHVPKSH
jgi:hypothetical protein